MAFSWLGLILNMKLPIYFGGTSLSLLDIIIGTIGILLAFGAVRALLKSGLSIGGKDLVASSKQYQNTAITAQRGNSYIDKLDKDGRL